MSKVFRLYNIQGNNNITDWQEAKVYGTQTISEITDPDGADAKKEITSIPSPFARIDLVKTAFREVVAMANRKPGDNAYAPFDGKTIYHKMVSDTLDVAEIFFNYDRFKNFFEIIVWDRTKDLDQYSVFGKTLKRYLESDATGDDPYNFGKLNRIYMLNYIGPDRPSNLNIVGATSPATLFFSSANDLSYVSKHVNFDGNDRPFDEGLHPLFKRNFEFQKYLYVFRKNYGEGQFHKDFPEIDDYLTSSAGKVCNYKYLTQQQKNQIDALTASSINDYEQFLIGERGQDTLDILGKSFHKKPNGTNWKSDFEIKSDLYCEGKKPLVLPVEKGNTYEKLKFTTDIWGKENKAPYEDATPFINRILPIVRDECPYLTIGDFLTWEIVRMPDEIDNINFFDGNINRANGNSYLLPLTDTFFKFFTVEDLQGMVDGNKKMFELQDIAPQNVRAVLRIPIQKGYIEYSRTYFAEMSVDKEHNDGAVVENKIGLGIMPLIRFPENVNKHYRIAMFDKGKNDAVLSCIDKDKTVESKQVVRAKKDLAGRGCSHESYIVEENFDRIKVEIGKNREISGYIVPKFKTDEGNAQYTFAIDFGTTNTHIEYCTNTNKSPVAFDIKANERQLHQLHTKYSIPDIRVGFVQEFIPDTIGDKSMYSFPMRTVFAQHKNIKYEQSPMPLADGNIPFRYEKDYIPEWNDIQTELKWGGVHERLLEMHLETLFILMRNKVILNGGDLAATKIIWFYPASMTEAKVNQFKKNWKAAYEKYFGENTKNVISISESKAPYIHYIETQGAAPEVVTIDVGGGTTDVFIVEGEEDKMLLSFRFASNAIFGDGYNSNPNKNGFIRKYKKQFEEILINNNMLELSQALTQIEQQNKSSDIVAFLFSLVGDKVKNNSELNFLQKLSNDDRLRYVFIVFYASILYFIAKSMKAKNIKKPKTLAFSGNGALSLRIISDEMNMIERFAKLIFDGVYGDTSGSIEVMMEKNPKIATCKGGIEKPVAQDYETIDNIKTILVGNDFDAFSDKKLTYADITEEVQNAVVQSVKDFFQFLFDLHSNNNDFLSSKLAADPAIFNKVKEFIMGEKGKQLLSVSMFKGLKNKRQEVNDETKLEETLFFYPLIGVLHDLALEITEM
jgi:hypothetical protein